MSGNTKDKIAVRNNASKTTPAATAHMANDYANAIVPKKNQKKNYPRLFANRKCYEMSLRFLCLNIKENDKFYQIPDRALANLGRYVATEHAQGSVVTLRPSTHTARSLRSGRERTQLGRYVATEHTHSSVAT
ncbi:hypothetical protein F2Q69_00043060 [Brassica cretica]|uniref:Uncharacterized protein n=1 Tax=Brassica cretica TaxID=69181 RepID=A0A8S9NJR6_BRACR|nr:hypothetical protein F2Q69_00043060 [Brassica cretica]